MDNKKKTKTIFAIIISIVILIIITIASITYFQYKNIETIKELNIKLTKIDVVSLKIYTTSIDTTISIYNPNERAVTVGEITLTLSANNMPLTTINIDSIKIPAKQTIEQTVPMQISNVDAGLAIIRAIQTKQASWKINGTYKIGPLKIPFEYKK